MRISFEWLKTLVDVKGLSAQELASELVRTGTEVEAIESEGQNFDHVVVGYVETCVDHPDSDHMHVTTVNVGSCNADEDGNPAPLQIVCGAPNIAAGKKVLVAMVGAVLPGDFKIKKAKLRGVESVGMICSARELGLGEDHNGIMILPEDAPVGMAASEYLCTGDTVIDCEITPNRPDCLNMQGFAKEVAATLDSSLKEPDAAEKTSKKTADKTDAADKTAAAQTEGAPCNFLKIQNETAPATETYASISFKDSPNDEEPRCTRYVARVLTDIKIKESPEWLQKRIRAAGARPINNVVDITNYVMFLTGQPLHAFDLDKLLQLAQTKKANVVVSAATQGEKIVTLDGEERTLTPQNTLINVETNDGLLPIALAGVMGGENSEIDETSTRVFLESAVFAPSYTSRTSRDLDLISEASLRYERGVDATQSLKAADIACALFEEYADAKIAEKPLDLYPNPVDSRCIELSVARVSDLAGAKIEKDFIASRLEKLGCKILGETEKEDARIVNASYLKGVGTGAASAPASHTGLTSFLTVEVPTSRPDLEREIDLVEEVIRLWDMEKIEPTIPAARNHTGGYSTDQKRIHLIKDCLEGEGLSEKLSLNFSSGADLVLFGEKDENTVPVELLAPLSFDQSFMRQSLIPGLLQGVAYNLAHGTENVALYEQGRVFFAHQEAQQPQEPTYISGVLSGQWKKDSWDEHPLPLDFFDAKGIVEKLLATLRITKYRFRPTDAERFGWIFPGRGAELQVNKRTVGWMGAIHPLTLQKFDIEKDVIAFELNQDELLAAARSSVSFKPISPYPDIEVDLAFTVPEDTTYKTCVERLRSAGGKFLKDVRLFDVYRDEKRLGPDKKSLAFALTFNGDERTLTQEEVDTIMEHLVEKIGKSLNAEVRK